LTIPAPSTLATLSTATAAFPLVATHTLARLAYASMHNSHRVPYFGTKLKLVLAVEANHIARLFMGQLAKGAFALGVQAVDFDKVGYVVG